MRQLTASVVFFCSALGIVTTVLAEDLRPVPLVSKVSCVQPMTGIVVWTTNEKAAQASIQLEFAYLSYNQVVREKSKYDWSAVEAILDQVASREHQAVLRWYDTYVGKPTGVPKYIQSLPGYQTTKAKSENKPTEFPDWSHPELRRFLLEFFSRFAQRYDRDPRLAFLQVGFGLWSEYHIYDGPMVLGKTFPSIEFQREFALHMDQTFRHTPWMISVDAAGDHTPFHDDRKLLQLPFGVFDDSFNHRRHREENEPNWNYFGRDRWQTAPAGGEFSFFESKDQRDALSPTGPHGIPFTEHASRFHISFILGDDQTRFQSDYRIKEAGLACGYRFRVTRFLDSTTRSSVTFTNTGIAPIYHDAYPAINGQRTRESLKGLLPGQTRTFDFPIGGDAPVLTIECDRLVPGQRIDFDADLGP